MERQNTTPPAPDGRDRGGVRQRFRAFLDPEQARSRWLARLTQSTDRYLRSQAFLSSVRCGMTALTSAQALHAAALTHLIKTTWLDRFEPKRRDESR